MSHPGGDPLLAQTQRPAAPTLDVETLYVEHGERLTQLASAITLDRWLAEEVVHDAFAGLQAADNDGPVSRPLPYLQRAVVNRSISILRRRRTSERHPLPPRPPAFDPEIDDTWAAVASLPPRERAVVVLRYWLDLSEREMAERLDWPAGTVKSTLHRALRRLEEELS